MRLTRRQDYHPPRHISFASRHGKPVFSDLELTDGRGRHYTQTLWPDHCIQGTKATEIVKELRDAFGPWKERMKIARKVSDALPNIRTVPSREEFG